MHEAVLDLFWASLEVRGRRSKGRTAVRRARAAEARGRCVLAQRQEAVEDLREEQSELGKRSEHRADASIVALEPYRTLA